MTADGDLLSVVVPAWNEGPILAACVRTLAATLGDRPHEILVVDDGSTDDTLAVAGRLADESPGRVRVLTHGRNMGLGAALKTGFAEAKGDYVMCCAADYLMTPADWAPFAASLGTADVLVGTRRAREGYGPLMRINAAIYPHLVALLFGLRLHDVNWTCVYRGELLRRVSIMRRGIPMLVEILVKLRDLGATFAEVPCAMQPRTVGAPAAGRLRVMWRTLAELLAFRLAYRRPGAHR